MTETPVSVEVSVETPDPEPVEDTTETPAVVVVETGSDDSVPPYVVELVERVTRLETTVEEVRTQAFRAEATAEVATEIATEVADIADDAQEVAETAAEIAVEESEPEPEPEDIEPSREHGWFRSIGSR